MNLPVMIACLAASITAAWTAWVLLGLRNRSPHTADVLLNPYQLQRLEVMRRSNQTFAFAEQLVSELVELNPPRGDAKEAKLQLALSMHSRWKVWKPNEFIATKLVESALVACTLVALLSWFLGVTISLLLGAGVGLLFPFLAKRSMLSKLSKQLGSSRSRLPFVVDQIALMMQAGANFEESLKAVVEDDGRHPLTREMAVVLNEIDAGVTRREALLNLRERIPSEEIEEFVFAVTKGEELGTPLSEILLEQSEQMRVKRSLWGEKAAAEAEVQIVFPGMLVMVACLIVVLGPIMLPPIVNLFAGGE